MTRVSECKNCGGRGCRDCHGLGFTNVPRPISGGSHIAPVKEVRETVVGKFPTFQQAFASVEADEPGEIGSRSWTITQEPDTGIVVLTVRDSRARKASKPA